MAEEKYTWENLIYIPTSEEAEEAIGKECYFADSPSDCLDNANRDENLGILESIIVDSIYPFCSKNSKFYGCIIVKKKPSYEECAKQWIEENDLKKGDYVKVTRKAEDDECGWVGFWRDDTMTKSVGKILKSEGTISSNYSIKLEDGFYYPYFVLEKVEEPKPKYVPFESTEEFLDAYFNAIPIFKSVDDDCMLERLSYYGVWLRLKATGTLFQVTSIGNIAIGVCGGINNTNYKDLLKDYEFIDGTPCGKEEE